MREIAAMSADIQRFARLTAGPFQTARPTSAAGRLIPGAAPFTTTSRYERQHGARKRPQAQSATTDFDPTAPARTAENHKKQITQKGTASTT